jgi:hypothetical protein
MPDLDQFAIKIWLFLIFVPYNLVSLYEQIKKINVKPVYNNQPCDKKIVAVVDRGVVVQWYFM